MQRTAQLVLLIILGIFPVVPSAWAQESLVEQRVTERVLPNGLKVLIIPRPASPEVRCMLAYRVGSANERPGITGISHLLEHMMFKGTRTMGIRPGTLERDTELMQEIDRLEAQLVKEEARGRDADRAVISDIRQKIYGLIDTQRKETIVSQEIWSAYQDAGGARLNASTGTEMTQYYVTLPKNKLELFLALEADRMVNPIFREFFAERDVVVEERRMSENRPGFFFEEQLDAAFYSASPYGWQVIGWMSDISRISKQDLIEFHKQYYRPDNAILALAGGVEVEPAMALVNKHFGDIENPPGDVPRVRTEEPSPEYYRGLYGSGFKVPYVEKRVIGRAAVSPYVTVMFHIPPVWHEDVATLQVLASVAGNRSHRMHLELVEQKNHAASITISASESKYDGRFTFRVTAREQGDGTIVPLDQLENELWTYIEDLKVTPCDTALLERVKNRSEAYFLQGLAGTSIAGRLLRMEAAYKWQFTDEQFRQSMAVTPEDMMRVARKYFNRDNSVTGVMHRER